MTKTKTVLIPFEIPEGLNCSCSDYICPHFDW